MALQKANARANGPIPPELGQLTDLTTLWLSFNRFSGPIPPELGRLAQLRDLQLNSNQLSGPIPVEFGNLTELTTLKIDSDTGLCLPAEIRETAFGRLAIRKNVPLCGTQDDGLERSGQIPRRDQEAAVRPENWCAPNQTVVINFQLEERARTASICREGGDALVYSFGVLGEAPELQFRGPLRQSVLISGVLWGRLSIVCRLGRCPYPRRSALLASR